MAGEIITATTLEEGKEELRGIYRLDAIDFKEITQEEYEAIERDEREDSDNHLNIEKLGKEEKLVELLSKIKSVLFILESKLYQYKFKLLLLPQIEIESKILLVPSIAIFFIFSSFSGFDSFLT